MPKEFRDSESRRVVKRRAAADANAATYGGFVEERDVSDWRPSPAESDVLQELRRLRMLPANELDEQLGVEFAHVGNTFEMDSAILLHLIRAHGTILVEKAVHELLGNSPAATRLDGVIHSSNKIGERT